MGNEEISFEGLLDDVEEGNGVTVDHQFTVSVAQVSFRQLRREELTNWVLSFRDWDSLTQGVVLRMLLKLEGLE